MKTSPAIEENHESMFTASRLLTGLAIGAAVVGAGVILAPHILSGLGLSPITLSEESMAILGHDNLARGVAGSLNSALSNIPLIGSELAKGGIFSALTAGAVGIGGLLLGNFIAHREDGSKRIKWGNVIKFAALATSAMIALPTVLTSLGTGIIYLSMLMNEGSLFSAATTNSIVALVSKTFGTIGGMGHNAMMGFSGMAAAIPHFLTCGMPFVPLALSMTALKDSPAPSNALALEIATDEPMQAGKPATLKVKIRNKATGKPLTPAELQVVHTEKLHLLVIDQSLQDYHHIHPQPTGNDGEFAATIIPTTNNIYSAWADITTLDGINHHLKTTLPSVQNRSTPAKVAMNNKATVGGLVCDWESNEPLQQNKQTLVHVTLRDAAGNPVHDLEPVMGAYAHLVGFCADGKSMIHAHPMGDEPQTPDERGGPRLSFHVSPESEGATQFFLQVKRNGQDVMVPFGQRIMPTDKKLDQELATRHHAAHANAGQAI